jgi:Na+/H+-dicarboxylate symporter
MSVLLIWKNKFLAFFISVVLGIVSFFFLLACFSEYSEFSAEDPAGTTLLLVGCSIFIPLIVISIVMPIKYFHKE